MNRAQSVLAIPTAESELILPRTQLIQSVWNANTAAVIVLILSGLLHLGLYAVVDAEWEGPVSPRKPGLFGVSAGLTAWSLLWCASVLRQEKRLRPIVSAVTWLLFMEVTLITAQYWRGVPSHFNRSNSVNAAIEISMVVLIMLATIGIARTCWLSMRPYAIEPTKLLAIRAGLWLLFLSCILGAVAMLCGEMNLAHGKSPEVWGQAGVLKYPHGAALHAIQTIPLINWLLTKCGSLYRNLMVKLVIAAHLCFLAQASWQTWQSRSRFDTDSIGGVLLVLATVLVLLPTTHLLAVIGRRAIGR